MVIYSPTKPEEDVDVILDEDDDIFDILDDDDDVQLILQDRTIDYDYDFDRDDFPYGFEVEM